MGFGHCSGTYSGPTCSWVQLAVDAALSKVAALSKELRQASSLFTGTSYSYSINHSLGAAHGFSIAGVGPKRTAALLYGAQLLLRTGAHLLTLHLLVWLLPAVVFGSCTYNTSTGRPQVCGGNCSWLWPVPAPAVLALSMRTETCHASFDSCSPMAMIFNKTVHGFFLAGVPPQPAAEQSVAWATKCTL